MFLTKEDIEHIRQQISLHCHWSDKVMNRLDDFLSFVDFEPNTIFQVEGHIISTEAPKLEMKQIQRKPEESS